MKKGSEYAIKCNPKYGPIFGDDEYSGIAIPDNSTQENYCLIACSFNLRYKAHPRYKSSLFVKTNGTEMINVFSLLDYEVYTHN